MPPIKTLLQIFIITTPDRRKLSIPPEKCFPEISFSQVERGEDYGTEKIATIEPVWICVKVL